MRCTYYAAQGDGLSKHNILPSLGNVYSAVGELLHATQNISADVPQLANNITKCALCEREKADLKAKADFNLRPKSTHTHAVKRKTLQNSGVWWWWLCPGSVCVLESYKHFNLDAVSVSRCPCRTSPTQNPRRWTQPAMVNTRTLRGSVDRGGPAWPQHSLLACLYNHTDDARPIKSQANSVFCGVFLSPSSQWTQLIENTFHEIFCSSF